MQEIFFAHPPLWAFRGDRETKMRIIDVLEGGLGATVRWFWGLDKHFLVRQHWLDAIVCCLIWNGLCSRVVILLGGNTTDQFFLEPFSGWNAGFYMVEASCCSKLGSGHSPSENGHVADPNRAPEHHWDWPNTILGWKFFFSVFFEKPNEET